ncbi:MAG TPA: chemotaxis protein CheX [Kofleriaceae bacterium]|nr:chemotaxis protein CheX [Kofleriaceae bacterium]
MPRLIDTDVIQRFLTVVVHQLRNTVGVDAMLAGFGDRGLSSESIAVTLDFAGDVRGPVTWVFPEQIALELVRRLMADPDPGPEMAVDGATELANILTGRASEVLETHGFRCEFGAPRVHTGALPDGMQMRMNTAAGPIDIVLSMMRRTQVIRTIPLRSA